MTEIVELVREAYPNHPDSDYWFCISDYDPLILSLGHEVCVQVDDSDYQGDTRLLLYDPVEDRYGLLIFGWGSCSGCDSLQACSNFDEVAELWEHLFTSIIWKNSAGEMLHFLCFRDWELQYAWHASETRSFIAQATDYLLEIVTNAESTPS